MAKLTNVTELVGPCDCCIDVQYCTERCEFLVKYEEEWLKQNPLPDFNTLWEQRHHEFIAGEGLLCPVTLKFVTQAYTDHEIKGVFPNGEIRRITSNSCALCGDPNFTIAGSLKKLNEKRKKEAERNDI
jgi:hypothetical protein